MRPPLLHHAPSADPGRRSQVDDEVGALEPLRERQVHKAFDDPPLAANPLRMSSQILVLGRQLPPSPPEELVSMVQRQSGRALKGLREGGLP